MRKEKICDHCKQPWTPLEHSGSQGWLNRRYCGVKCTREAQRNMRTFARKKKPHPRFRELSEP